MSCEERIQLLLQMLGQVQQAIEKLVHFWGPFPVWEKAFFCLESLNDTETAFPVTARASAFFLQEGLTKKERVNRIKSWI